MEMYFIGVRDMVKFILGNYCESGACYFNLGNGRKGSIVRTSDGYFETIVKDSDGVSKHQFTNPLNATIELLSHCEISSEDF